MKKIISLLLALTLLLGLTGCIAPAQNVPTTEDVQVTTLPDSTLPDSTLPQPTENDLPEQTDPPIDPATKKQVPYLIGKDLDTALKILKTHGFADPKVVKVNSTDPEGVVVDQSRYYGEMVAISSVLTIKVSNGVPPTTQPPREDDTQPPRQEDDTQPDTQPQTDPATEPATQPPTQSTIVNGLDKNGSYTSAKDVALYIRTFGKLPPNFITKSQARSMYGTTSGLNKYGKCIGGDRFYNNEGLLPNGYTYYECDIDTLYSSKRGAKRLVYTKSGIIYYTDDHYESFTKLYG